MAHSRTWLEQSVARLAPLWTNMPAPRRALSEAAFVVAAVLAASLVDPLAGRIGPWPAAGLVVALLWLWGAWLLGTSVAWGAGPAWRRAGLQLALLAALVVDVVGPSQLVSSGASLFGSRALLGLSLRNLAVLVLVGLLLQANRQSAAQLGLRRAGLAAELLVGVAALAGAFAVHLVVSVLAGAVVAVTSTTALEGEAEQRLEVVTDLVSNAPLPSFALVVLVAAAFEEIVFRGFVLPRVKQLFRGWLAPLLLVSLLFGAGHAYEGGIAVVQTAALGLYFGAVFIWRGRLASVIAAHACFNTIMVLVALWLRDSAVLDQAEQLLSK